MNAAGLIAAACLPSAPLFVSGVGRGFGPALEQLQGGVHRAVRTLPRSDVVVLVGAGQPALHDTVVADLTGLGYPAIRRELSPAPGMVAALSRLTQYPRVRKPRLPLDLACLALLLGRDGPVVGLEVSASAEYGVLSALGGSVAQALGETGLRGSLVVAGDLSAALDPGSPLAARDGAAAWDERVVDLCTTGTLGGLAELGPAAATDFGARGWAPLCVLHGALASCDLRLDVRRYAAPRGVGYLIASTT